MDQEPIDLTVYHAIYIQISGGKDSQVSLTRIRQIAREQGVLHRLNCIYADTGAEWRESVIHCDWLCKQFGIPLYTVYPIRPLPDEIARRGMWPSMKCRYCTSMGKHAPISKLIRNRHSFKEPARILMVSGERREESPQRAKLAEFEQDTELSAGHRQVFKYRPVLKLRKWEIWQKIRASGLKAHPAYALGNDRLSCALCVFANITDLKNGARARPDLAQRYLEIEREKHHDFRYKQSLASILYPSCSFLSEPERNLVHI